MVVTMLAYLRVSPSEDTARQFRHELTVDESTRVDELIADLANLLAPLVRINSDAALGEFLRSTTPKFFAWKKEMVELLWPYLTNPEDTSRVYEEIRELVHSKSDLLGESALEELLGAIDSAEGLNEWAMNSVQSGRAAAYLLESRVQQVGESVQYADICMNTLLLVLSEQLTDWEPSAVPMLASAADEYMTNVEDAYLSASVDSEAGGPAIDYEAVRRDLGV